MNARSRSPSIRGGSARGAAFAVPYGQVDRRMRRGNPYADLSALLDTTRKLADEEMAELQLELGYTERALFIYERLLRSEPRNEFFRRRCEWLIEPRDGRPRLRRERGRGCLDSRYQRRRRCRR